MRLRLDKNSSVLSDCHYVLGHFIGNNDFCESNTELLIIFHNALFVNKTICKDLQVVFFTEFVIEVVEIHVLLFCPHHNFLHMLRQSCFEEFHKRSTSDVFHVENLELF